MTALTIALVILACIAAYTVGLAHGHKDERAREHAKRSQASRDAAKTKARRKQDARLAQTAARVGLDAWDGEDDVTADETLNFEPLYVLAEREGTVPSTSEGAE